MAGWWTPEQISLSWTENENEMRATWVTLWWVPKTWIAYRPILCDTDQTDFKFIEGEKNMFEAGDDITHNIWIHTGVMTDIRAECSYEYYVGMSWLWSDTFYFAGLTPDYEKPYEQLNMLTKVLVFGDWGIGPIGHDTMDLLYKHSKLRTFDAILHIGDLGYDLHDFNGHVGDIFGRIKEPVAANFPYMTIPGNHEDHNNATAYKHRYLMPENEANNKTNTFYSFNLGPAHYVMFDTEINFDDDKVGAAQTQYNWLVDDLTQANKERDIRPWLILGSHHPLYCSVNWRIPMMPYRFDNLKSNGDCGEDSLQYQAYYEELFNEMGVDIYFQAHVHNYERDSPIYKNVTVKSEKDEQNYHFNANAPVYIVSGNAGNHEGHNDPISPTPQDWEIAESNSYGYGRFIVYNSTHAYWEYFDSYTEEVIDYLWLEKDRPRYTFNKEVDA